MFCGLFQKAPTGGGNFFPPPEAYPSCDYWAFALIVESNFSVPSAMEYTP
jgi:hypothetical protein